MNRKKNAKPEDRAYLTQEFDEEFVAERAKAMTPTMKARWERAKQKPANGETERTISVRLDKTLLERCATLARKKRLSRDALVARGLRALLAAEGE